MTHQISTPNLSEFEINLIRKHEQEIMFFTEILFKVVINNDSELFEDKELKARFDRLPKIVQNECYNRGADQLE